MSEQLPPPLVPPEVDVHDLPLPIDFFVEMAVRTYGVAPEQAREVIEAYERARREGRPIL